MYGLSLAMPARTTPHEAVKKMAHVAVDAMLDNLARGDTMGLSIEQTGLDADGSQVWLATISTYKKEAAVIGLPLFQVAPEEECCGCCAGKAAA